jgi:hypothetical protein
LDGAGRANVVLSRISIDSQGLRATWTCAVESWAKTRSPVTLPSQCKVEGTSRESIPDRVERDRGVTAAPGWPERTIIVDCIELLVDADYTPAAVIAWEEHCKPITQANIAVGERVAIGDVHPPEDLR